MRGESEGGSEGVEGVEGVGWKMGAGAGVEGEEC